MYTYIVMVSAMAICVGSLILILRKRKVKKEDLLVVPISDVKEIQQFKESFIEQNKELKSLMPDPVKELLENEVKKDTESMDKKEPKNEIEQEIHLVSNERKEYEKLQKELLVAKEISKREAQYFIGKIEELEKEKMDLKEALFKEVSFREDVPVMDHEREEYSSAKKQLESVEKTTHDMHETNKKLLDRIQNQKDSIRQMQEEIKKIKSKSYEVQNEDRYKIEELETKLSDVIGEKEKMEKEYDDIEKLTTYNLKLRMKNVTYARALNAQKIILDNYEHNNKTKDLQVNSIISELKMENGFLVSKVKESVASVQNLKEQIDLIKEDMQEKVEQLNKNMDLSSVSSEEMQEIKSENEQLKRDLSNVEIKLNALREERKQLLSDIKRNEFNYDKLKEFNSHILAKEKMLQYELTKSRAKALGLEKICEDFKAQIESSHKRTNRINRVVTT